MASANNVLLIGAACGGRGVGGSGAGEELELPSLEPLDDILKEADEAAAAAGVQHGPPAMAVAAAAGRRMRVVMVYVLDTGRGCWCRCSLLLGNATGVTDCNRGPGLSCGVVLGCPVLCRAAAFDRCAHVVFAVMPAWALVCRLSGASRAEAGSLEDGMELEDDDVELDEDAGGGAAWYGAGG